ncbi:hypothetical protein [Candidatus Korobacter versatilis]|uniref:hypothetical protein n=1 Tax=Candidatus Korobacter versatilis TaxID=658062 RepID=UPI000308B398|nr:hypothetical protein [Candidatus Koribacter versatilis]
MTANAMFESLEEDIRKVDNDTTDRQSHFLRVLGFLAIVGGITVLVIGALWAGIRYME